MHKTITLPIHIAVSGSRYGSMRKGSSQAVKRLQHMIDDDTLNNCVLHLGGAKGVDTEVEKWARWIGLDVLIFKPQWDRYGKAAGPMRNVRMLSGCSILYAFPKRGKPNKGTQDAIRQGKILGAVVRTYEV